MRNWIQKILLTAAVVTVIGHSILPHIHQIGERHDKHDAHFTEAASGKQHQEEESSKEDHHGVFSFSQLDDSYIPVLRLLKYFDLSFEFLPALSADLVPANFQLNTKIHPGRYDEYPPPVSPVLSLLFRGPPSV